MRKAAYLRKNYIGWYAFEIWSLLSKKRKYQVIILFITMLISGISEVLFLGSFIPLIALITKPEQITKLPFLKSYSDILTSSEFVQILKPIIFFFIFIVLITTIIKIYNSFLIERISAKIASDLSYQLYRQNIYKSYLSHLNHNSSKIISNMTIQMNRTINACKLFFKMITSFVTGGLIFLGLLYINISIAFSITFAILILYLLIVLLVRNQININSKNILNASTARIKILQESIGGIRELLLSGNQPIFLNIFRKPNQNFYDLISYNNFLSEFPRILLQGLILIILTSLSSIFLIERNQDASYITLIATFAIGMQRMFPQFQQFYGSWSLIRSFSYDIKAVIEGIKQPTGITIKPNYKIKKFKKITLQNVYFKYVNNQDYVLKNINLEIKRGEKIGFIGTTGSGKSTIIDILMGLLQPTKGKFLVDGQDLYDKKNESLLVNWRHSIAHVPQNIFLADCSVKDNITFGEPSNKFDIKKVELASKKANIHNFIKTLNLGYKTLVGERGVLLSGGQIQRIGIARALYKNNNILILDEATSALDIKTEGDIINKINNISKGKLIIMVSHRFSTLKKCDLIFKIKKGAIIDSGNPEEILKD